jgi:ATP-dependent helicase/nuclease subunit B
MTLDNFYKIFKIGLKNSNLGKIPSTQDGVTVGDTERSRTHKVKAIFIIGLNDGVFPSVNKNEGFFNDKDRSVLKEQGIELAKGTIENLYDDNFNIYKAFTTAEEKLFLSYSSSDTDGKSLRPSTLILKIKKIFINLKEQSDILENKNYFINEKEAYENLILNINNFSEKNNCNKIKLNEKNNNNKIKLNEENDIDKINLIEEKINKKSISKNNLEKNDNLFLLYKYFTENKNYQKILKNNLEYIKFLKMPEKIKKENIQKLYGNKLNTSVSKLETFKSCPYEYFLQYSLKLKEKEELKVNNIDTGSFMHDVINSFFEELIKQKINVKNIDEETTEKIINKIIDEKLNSSKNYIFTATEKYKLLVKRLKRIILKALKYIILSLKASDFEVAGTEVAFDEKRKI